MPPGKKPRSSLAKVTQHQVPIDSALSAILTRWDQDEQFYSDLESLMFEVNPCPGDDLDCRDPWFFVIAMDGAGSAYGLYLRPGAGGYSQPPWVFWDHEVDTIYDLPSDTQSFFGAFLAFVERSGSDSGPVSRVRKALAEMNIDPAQDAADISAVHFGSPRRSTAPWLPPPDPRLKSEAEYLQMLAENPSEIEAEAGLLAYATRHIHLSETAMATLQKLYNKRGWRLPFGDLFEDDD